MPEIFAAVYARVSSEQQAEEHTIDSQVAALRMRVAEDGLRLPADREFLDEGYSGATLVRPALEQVRDLVAAGGIDRLYVHSPDRLARRYAYQALLLDEFKAAGVEVVFLNRALGESPEDELLLQVQGMVAEYERYAEFGISLILGDDALHLNQQCGFRIVVEQRSIEIVDLDAMPEQLVGDQNLIRVAARQPVGGQAPDVFEHAGFGGIAQCVQTRAVEASPGVAVIDIFMDHLLPKLGHLEATPPIESKWCRVLPGIRTRLERRWRGHGVTSSSSSSASNMG